MNPPIPEDMAAAELAAVRRVAANVRAALDAAGLEGLRPAARAVQIPHPSLDRKLSSITDFNVRELARIAYVTGVGMEDLSREPEDAA